MMCTMNQEYHRNRLFCVIATCGIILLGLYTRSTYPCFTFLREYAGDFLYPCMIYMGILIIKPNVKVSFAFLGALSFSFFIEFTQVLDFAWLLYLRSTMLRLVLGQGFVWSDLVCYCLGTMMVAFLDMQMLRFHKKRG